jgi:hypothetical protein
MPVVCSITVHVLGTAAIREQIGAILASAVYIVQCINAPPTEYT